MMKIQLKSMRSMTKAGSVKIRLSRLTNGLASLVCTGLMAITATAEASQSLAERSRERYLDASEGHDWPGYGRTYGEQHYSPLTQISQDNINRLGLQWWLDLDPKHTVTQPIAVDGILYFAIGHSIVHAVDAATGKLLWRYDAHAVERAGINLRYYGGSRGIAWWNGKIYTGTRDGRLIAIDARTGKPVWTVQTLDKDAAAFVDEPPRVFAGKVIIGFGSDIGKNRGYVTTYDAETGKQLWRFYTVPGNPADGFENDAMKMAAKTWAGEWWKFGGGGAVWQAIAYDPETDTIFIGVGAGFPGNRRVRSEDKGDNLFLSSIVALDGKTGAYKWHYQEAPGDTWDFDASLDIELADLTIDGKARKVLMQAAKDGFYYVIDRLNGRLISAEPYVKVTWASRIDLKTGRPVESPGARYESGTALLIFPGHGTRPFLPMAYSPRRRLAYLETGNTGAIFNDSRIDIKTWQAPTDRRIMGASGYMAAERTEEVSCCWLLAWDPVTQRAAWKRKLSWAGGVMATAGDLVFEGEVSPSSVKGTAPADGTFDALDAATGKLLWSFAAQGPVTAPPLSYWVDGKQYVTVLTGLGQQRRRVLTFALDGTAKLPVGLVALPTVEDPKFEPDAARAEAGALVYEAHCRFCHQFSDLSRLNAPDLRRSAVPLSAEAFATVVRGGARVPMGMPVFGEFTEEQLADLRQYIRSEAERLRIETRAK